MIKIHTGQAPTITNKIQNYLKKSSMSHADAIFQILLKFQKMYFLYYIWLHMSQP